MCVVEYFEERYNRSVQYFTNALKTGKSKVLMKNHNLFVLGLVLALPFMAACGSTATPRYEADAIVRDANLTATAIIDSAQAQVEADDIVGIANATATAIVAESGDAEVTAEGNMVESFQATAISFVEEATEVVAEATEAMMEVTEEVTEMVEETVEATEAAEVPSSALSEVTPEVVVEETSEATEVMVEEMAEATEAMIEETVEATEAVVEETPEVTPEMTMEATEEAAAEVTEAAVVSVTEEVEATEAMAAEEEVIEPDFDPVPADEDPLQIVIELSNAENGEALFNATYETSLGAWACSTCHNIDNDEVKIGPSLWGIPERANLRVEGQGPYTYLYNSIHNSQAYLVPGYEDGAQMPLYEGVLTDTEIYDLVAYLMTLDKPE